MCCFFRHSYPKRTTKQTSHKPRLFSKRAVSDSFSWGCCSGTKQTLACKRITRFLCPLFCFGVVNFYFKNKKLSFGQPPPADAFWVKSEIPTTVQLVYYCAICPIFLWLLSTAITNSSKSLGKLWVNMIPLATSTTHMTHCEKKRPRLALVIQSNPLCHPAKRIHGIFPIANTNQGARNRQPDSLVFYQQHVLGKNQNKKT